MFLLDIIIPSPYVMIWFVYIVALLGNIAIELPIGYSMLKSKTKDSKIIKSIVLANLLSTSVVTITFVSIFPYGLSSNSGMYYAGIAICEIIVILLEIISLSAIMEEIQRREIIKTVLIMNLVSGIAGILILTGPLSRILALTCIGAGIPIGVLLFYALRKKLSPTIIIISFLAGAPYIFIFINTMAWIISEIL